MRPTTSAAALIVFCFLYGRCVVIASFVTPSSRPIGSINLPTPLVEKFRQSQNIRHHEMAPVFPNKVCPATRSPRKTGEIRSVAVAISWASFSSSPSAVKWWSMALLALQFACQPILTKSFAPKGIVRTTYVLAGDLLRLGLCALILTLNSSWSVVGQQWSPLSTLLGAGIPAVLYAIQNYCSLMAYQHLPPISYNVLNQTKTLSAAVFCYFLLSKPQSLMQIVSLFVLLGSALIIEKVLPIPFRKQQTREDLSRKLENRVQETEFIMGVAPVLLASMISGLAGALCQKALQDFDRDPYFFSMEISICSALVLLSSLLVGNPDAEKISDLGVGHGWTKKTWIPLLTSE